MNKNVELSVLMPVYNQKAYVRQAIESILNQTFQDFEFIIVNDGSTEATLEIINDYRDSRIKVYNFHRSQGVAKSLNYGLSKARGNFIARMDSDDISVTNRFEIQLKLLKKKSDLAICGGCCEFINQKGELIRNGWIKHFDHNNIKLMLLFGNPICHPTVMIRKEVLIKNSILYNENYSYAEDFKMWYELSKVSKLANIQEVLLKYRIHSQQVSWQKILLQKTFSIQIVREQLSDLKIIPSENELDTHIIMSNFHFREKKLLNVDACIDWIKKLEDANAKQNIYDQVNMSNLVKTLVKKFRYYKREL